MDLFGHRSPREEVFVVAFGRGKFFKKIFLRFTFIRVVWIVVFRSLCGIEKN